MSPGFDPALRATREKLAGRRPGVWQSFVAAFTLGLTVAVLSYRLLRREGD
jgi:hypothetical protein